MTGWRAWLPWGLTVPALLIWAVTGPGLRADAQTPASGARAGAPAKAAPAQPHAHSTPAGWRFAWPKGDPERGRAVFTKLECYSCHEVRGESFPAPSGGDRVGPELSQMGPLHSPEYFAESIVNPGATIERGHGYAAPDGSSKMPSYNDAVTVQEVIDLVAYLAFLKPTGSPAGQGGRPAPPRPSSGHGH